MLASLTMAVCVFFCFISLKSDQYQTARPEKEPQCQRVCVRVCNGGEEDGAREGYIQGQKPVASTRLVWVHRTIQTSLPPPRSPLQVLTLPAPTAEAR